jgi:hypothetical protein
MFDSHNVIILMCSLRICLRPVLFGFHFEFLMFFSSESCLSSSNSHSNISVSGKNLIQERALTFLHGLLII